MKLPKLRKRIAEVAEAIRRAEKEGDDERVDALYSYLLALKRQEMRLRHAKAHSYSPR